MDPSTDEASKRQLDAARRQGEAYGEAARLMMEEVAVDGGEQQAGDYLIGYAVEKAEGMHRWTGSGLEWVEPDDENLHLEVVVRDAADGRLVPGVRVEATLTAPDGSELGPFDLPFLWHPMIDHYGRNVVVPGDGDYRLRVRVEPPTYSRHDKVNGRRFEAPVTAEFESVHVEAGQG
ncbi:MAG: iron transporter [Acidimicrobiales bacterium]